MNYVVMLFKRCEMISCKMIKNLCICVNRICEDFELYSCIIKYIVFKNSL